MRDKRHCKVKKKKKIKTWIKGWIWRGGRVNNLD
jgi:hypothetical protein